MEGILQGSMNRIAFLEGTKQKLKFLGDSSMIERLRMLQHDKLVVCQLGIAAFAIAGGALTGWMVVSRQFLEIEIFALVAVTLVVLARPVLGVVATLAFSFVNPNLLPPLGEVGPFTFRIPDAVMGILLTAILFRSLSTGKLKYAREWWLVFSPLVGFVLYIGASLVLVALYVPSFLLDAVASYARLIDTMAFAWLLVVSVRREKDLDILMRSVIALSVMSVGIGGWEAWSKGEVQGVLAGRFGGLLGINAFGLVSGLLVLYGFIACLFRQAFSAWRLPAVLGLIGLILSKSVSSTLATFGSLATGWALSKKGGLLKGRTMRVAMAAAIGIPLLIAAVWVLRPSDAQGLVTLEGGSLAQRLMIGYVGLKIFAEHPIFGVGWQASGTSIFIGDPELNAVLMAAFPKLPRHYFFLERTTSLHNMYIQILAELGLVGFGLFMYGVIGTGKVVIRILRELPEQSPYKRWATFCALGLVYLLIWWNTNPLYGGQTESILAFSFLSVLAVLWRLEKAKVTQPGSI